MILNDKELKALIEVDDSPLVYPVSNNGIQPASVDVRLGDSFLKPGTSVLYRNSDNYNAFNMSVEYEKYSGEYIINPHEFILATTVEYLRLPNNLTAFVEGRSSIGRMGLFVQNAGWVDPGFEGQITLELFNASEVPILLKPFTRVAQLVFCKIGEDCKVPYNGKYQSQTGATGSLINLDNENERK